jgi:TolB-like protein
MSAGNEGIVNTRDRRAAVIAVARFDPFSHNLPDNRLELGFLEDVIAELSRVPDFEVLAPRTSLNLSGDDLDPKRLSEAFGVTHLLDTGLRAIDDRLQVKANLVEAETGRVIWSHRYEASKRGAGDVLADIAAHVANAMSVRVRLTRLADARSRPLTSLDAQDCWVRGHEHLRRSTPEDDQEARRLFERALAIDPGYGRAYAGLALSHFKRWNWRAATPQEEEGDRLSAHYAAKAAALDDMDPVVQVVLGRTEIYRRNYGPGQRALERALSLSPNHADCLMQMAPLWAYLGEEELALDLVRKAFRLNPLCDPWYYFTSFIPYFVARELEAGVAILEQSPPAMIFEQSA